MRVETDSIEDIIKAIGDGKEIYKDVTGKYPGAVMLGQKLQSVFARDYKKLGLSTMKVYGMPVMCAQNVPIDKMYFADINGSGEWFDNVIDNSRFPEMMDELKRLHTEQYGKSGRYV